MKNSELKKYLNTFPDDEDVSFLIADPRGRKLYRWEQIDLITDVAFPVLGIIVGAATDMDKDMIEACEECEREAEQLVGQMDITDFPEVLP